MPSDQRMDSRRNWTEDELTVLAAVFFKGSFSLGDDARDECQTIAACFGRTAASIDRQWRNMDAVLKNKSGVNVGKLVRITVQRFLSDPQRFSVFALKICEYYGWPLKELIKEGTLSDSSKPEERTLTAQEMKVLMEACDSVEFTVFPSGSQGFEAHKMVRLNQSFYKVMISAVILGSAQNRNIKVTIRGDRMARALKRQIENVKPKKFVTGRIGYYGAGKLTIDSHILQVTIRAIDQGGDQ